MPTPAIVLEVLPAGYGDCLLLSCPVGARTWRMLIDTGPDECYPQLRTRLALLPKDSTGRRFIDVRAGSAHLNTQRPEISGLAAV